MRNSAECSAEDLLIGENICQADFPEELYSTMRFLIGIRGLKSDFGSL